MTWSATGTSAATSFTLVDSPGIVPYTNLSISASRSIQRDNVVRARQPVFSDRRNRSTEVTFNTTRLFADPPTAEAFLMMHETMFPDGQRFLVTFQSGNGVAVASKYLANAVVQSIQSTISGATTRHSYRITGGVFTTNKAGT